MTKIISGGETGADIGALVGASKAGVPTGGTASRDYMTEKGSQAPVLKASFGLIPHPSHLEADRVFENIKKADVTAIFTAAINCSEVDQVVKVCEKLNKKHIVIDAFAPTAAETFHSFVLETKPDCLNITGDKESKSAGIAITTSRIICSVMTTITKGGFIDKRD